jgi:hypothetical protein
VTRRERLTQVIDFVRSVGIEVREGPIERKTLVPGIDVIEGALLVEEGRMSAPPDLLHEAAHIALTVPAARPTLDNFMDNTPAQEMSAIAWTWAAAMHLGIPPEEVFHEEVISGNGPTLRENFQNGRFVGVPLLQLWGLTHASDYPRMARWLRE